MDQGLPWGLRRIGLPRAWQRSRGQGVRVAVIDTGADWTHPDLAPRVRGGVNILAPGEPPGDDNGHGTHVAGIVAAADNAAGVVGVAPGADLYVVKAFDRDGSAALVDLLQALQWCADYGMQVINMSFGQPASSPALARAVEALTALGAVLVAAAGNGGAGRPVDFPARYPHVLAVTATDPRDTLARSSSRGPEVDLAAPGTGIVSLWPGGRLRSLSGTSMAAAHVAGAAALLLAAEPGLTPGEVRDRLRATAEPLPGLSPAEQGAGLVRPDRALAAAMPVGADGDMAGEGQGIQEGPAAAAQ
nr:MAG: peptidase S8 [Bacillota bacterium]